jgi:hypothetical protein
VRNKSKVRSESAVEVLDEVGIGIVRVVSGEVVARRLQSSQQRVKVCIEIADIRRVNLHLVKWKSVKR